MHVAGHAYTLMSSGEVEAIHGAAMTILREMGIEVQNDALLSVLADCGLPVERDVERVRFPTAFVEQFIAGAPKHDWENATPRVSGSAGVYHGLYHDPLTGDLVPWTEERLAFYCRLARSLEHIGSAGILGCRFPVQPELEPLYERYYAWKHGAGDHGSIHLDEICPYVLELYEVAASHSGKLLRDVFHGQVYLVPALKLGRHEAYQVAYFRERGLRVHIGDMYAMGGSAPVTLAGAVALNVAEQLALRILDWALFGVRSLHLGSSISVMDMKTAIYPYGRPEMAITNLMTAQMARFYGASFSGHAGLSDAKLPSVEAGAQKALTAIPTLLGGGSLWMDAGLLCIDEVFSPIQMALDDEFLGALKQFTREFEISPETLALETIFEAGPGGGYVDKMHTARRFRKEHWQPGLWSREMLSPWLKGDRQIDADRACERVLALAALPPEPSFMSEDLEQDVLALIARAGEALVPA
jgi:trimethylamine--corrinoid protein Co-methyltransferase